MSRGVRNQWGEDLVNAASQPFKFVFYSEFFFFESSDPDIVPVGVRQFGLYRLL